MVGFWPDDSVTSRFGQEAWTEERFRGLKQLTSKPVVGVGWLTSPDTMVRLVRDGVLDLIGAARPSIADPFLPRKIEEGRLEDIRECIGCNICVTGDWTATPIRCTQNPSMGEEWRRGWHPERFRPQGSEREGARRRRRPCGARGGDGARPARLRGRARRGDARAGRARAAARRGCPGLAAWIRVVDYRRRSSAQLPNVDAGARERGRPPTTSSASASQHVAVATGSRWRRDGVGRRHTQPLAARPGAGDAHPGRPARRRAAGGRARARLRRRPLLPRRRARRAARRARAQRRPRHARAARSPSGR